MKLKLLKTLILSLILSVTSLFSQKKIWETKVINGKVNNQSVNSYIKKHSKTLTLNFTQFKEQLKGVSLRGVNTGKSEVIINLPDEKGKVQSFRIFEAPVFAPSLAAKFPDIKSYVGYSVDNLGTVVRMSVSPKGVQTMISYKNKSTVFMQPLEGDVEKYIVYNRLAKNNLPKEEFICSTADEIVKDAGKSSITQRDADDQILRKFRLAMSVNGEYTQFHGGTVAGALAAINATITRTNAVFETDMAITFEVQDFPALIYTNAATDPYSGSLSAWNVELQNTLTNTIGNAAYDIGHMFGASGGGGNAGCIGCVCFDDTASTSDTEKGSGITSPADGIPQGDTFDIDYVAHEIGHQMGANHTFSHSTEGTGVNSEPGSGSTIMGYAGITGANNVQQNSDAYFHYQSIRQITDNVTNTRTCWQANSPVTLTNNPPNANAGADYTIPQGTAYVLRGTATDADGSDNLTYCWEGSDSGQVTNTQFGPTRTLGSMARSLPPTISSDRYIPKMSEIVNGNLTQTNPTINSAWETVATVARDINWALTVRDRAPTATGLNGQSSFDIMKITVDATSGPFAVTSQTTNETWDVGSTQTVTWDVAGTDSGAVNTATVNIKMSIDGGVTFPYILATGVPNDGSHNISVPATGGDTSEARIMVEGNGNIFLAVNSSNFSTQESEFALAVANPVLDVCAPNQDVYNFTYNTFLGFTGTTEFSASNLPAGTSVSFNPTSASADGTNVTATITVDGTTTLGAYDAIELVGTSGTIVKSTIITLNVFNNTFATVNPTSPSNGTTGTSLTPTLQWDTDSNAASYDLEVATDNSFSNIVASGNVTTNSYTVPSLMQSTEYFWRVKPKNICGEGSFSTVFSFTTQNCNACASTGNTSFETSTTLVKFNTIDNVSAKPSGYSDYTSISTTVEKGVVYDLTVNVNTDGNYRVQVKAWIDWNQDCTFDVASEEYDLGFALNNSDGPTDLSPYSINIPAGALTGNTVMRIISRYTSAATITYPTSCQTSFDGETEDYTIEVQSPVATIEDFAFSGFSLYPNPSNGEINLAFEVLNTDEVKTQLYDVRGRKVSQKTFKNVSTQFSEKLIFDTVSTGIYLLRISNGGKVSTRKIIIE